MAKYPSISPGHVLKQSLGLKAVFAGRVGCSAYNDPSFDCGSRRCADACLRRDDGTGRIECLNEMHVKNNSAAKCLLPREGVATRWCGVATPAPSPRPPSRPKKHESISLWHSLFG